MDDLDVSLLRLLLEEPRAGMREYARILEVARGTVQSRLSRLERSGVLTGFAPRLDLAALGYPVLAIVHVNLAQGRLDEVAAGMERIPEVVDAYTIAGDGDLVCRVVAKDNTDLEAVIQQLIKLPGVVRTKTEIVLKERIPYRVLPLLTRTQRT
ncbi:Lrp/AsnC family transcriptional regulator [Actinomadura viridis]|uniref:Lrp/AsnC family transcriptional regulator n=1 Tax=Actinomadura viridis TaxID=58110 RepID=UPI003693FBB2